MWAGSLAAKRVITAIDGAITVGIVAVFGPWVTNRVIVVVVVIVIMVIVIMIGGIVTIMAVAVAAGVSIAFAMMLIMVVARMAIVQVVAIVTTVGVIVVLLVVIVIVDVLMSCVRVLLCSLIPVAESVSPDTVIVAIEIIEIDLFVIVFEEGISI